MDIRDLIKTFSFDCLKMDIEGSEIEILKCIDNWNLKKLVFEYSFNVDRSIHNFLSIVSSLKREFDVSFKKMPNKDNYYYFPSGVLVYCLKKNN